MKPRPPDPLDVPWVCKSVDSARSGIEFLPDGRMKCWIEHEILRGVTPAMLVWWFGHLEEVGNFEAFLPELYAANREPNTRHR